MTSFQVLLAAAATAASALHERPWLAEASDYLPAAFWRLRPEPNTYSEAVAEKTVAAWVAEAAEGSGGSRSLPQRWLSARSQLPATTRQSAHGLPASAQARWDVWDHMRASQAAPPASEQTRTAGDLRAGSSAAAAQRDSQLPTSAASRAVSAGSAASQLVSGASKAAADGATGQAAQASAYVWHPDKYWPSIFVAVFSRRSAATRRALVREMWQRADYKQSKLLVRFALCAINEDFLASSLEDENARYGDLMIMPCREGYSEGLLTKKTLTAMQEYRANYWQQQLFMKIDDDTFAAWSRLWPLVAQSWETHGANIYMGAQKPPVRPSRDRLHAFFEPAEVYPMEEYPRSADGGPGYILGGRLVARILDEHIGERWQLYNEDKAVGVWVDALVQQGVMVSYVNVYGQTGYAPSEREWQNQLRWFHQGKWIAYPLILHHRLSGEAIACLSRVEALKNPNATIDHCFSEADNTWVPINFFKPLEALGGKLWESGLKRLALKRRESTRLKRLATQKEGDT